MSSSSSSYSYARQDSSYVPPMTRSSGSAAFTSSLTTIPTGTATRFIQQASSTAPVTTKGRDMMPIGLGIAGGILALIIAVAVFFILRREKRIKREKKFEHRTSGIRAFAPGAVKDEHEMEQKA